MIVEESKHASHSPFKKHRAIWLKSLKSCHPARRSSSFVTISLWPSFELPPPPRRRSSANSERSEAACFTWHLTLRPSLKDSRSTSRMPEGNRKSATRRSKGACVAVEVDHLRRSWPIWKGEHELSGSACPSSMTLPSIKSRDRARKRADGKHCHLDTLAYSR